MTKLNTATNPYPSEEEFYKRNTKVSPQDLQKEAKPRSNLAKKLHIHAPNREKTRF